MPILCGSPNLRGALVWIARDEEGRRALVDCTDSNQPAAACVLGLVASIW
jgi:hypothetical protein